VPFKSGHSYFRFSRTTPAWLNVLLIESLGDIDIHVVIVNIVVVVAISDDNSDWHDPRNHVFVWAVIPVDWSAPFPFSPTSSKASQIFQGKGSLSSEALRLHV
jgi:hypothetical protein